MLIHGKILFWILVKIVQITAYATIKKNALLAKQLTLGITLRWIAKPVQHFVIVIVLFSVPLVLIIHIGIFPQDIVKNAHTIVFVKIKQCVHHVRQITLKMIHLGIVKLVLHFAIVKIQLFVQVVSIMPGGELIWTVHNALYIVIVIMRCIVVLVRVVLILMQIQIVLIFVEISLHWHFPVICKKAMI